MKNTTEVVGSGSNGEDRFAGAMPYRATRRRDALGLPQQSSDGERGATPPPLEDMSNMPTMLEPPQVPSMSISDLNALSEPTFPPVGWLDDRPTGTLADHPLLRGLLMELPAKGVMPGPAWMDRWFDAARAILDLLYVQTATAEPGVKPR